MKTADLIKKKEEEKNNPLQETTTTSMPTAPKPAEGMNMAEARMAGNGGVFEMETTTPVTQTANTTTNPVSLYEIGKQAGNINQAENVLAGKSPITTPEYEKFRNEVIGAQQFGVETEEQKKKRERADFIKQGLTGLTEGLSSLANLYYTTKWAPNQKMTSQMPALQKQLYQERLERDKKLENFRAWQRQKADKDADRAWQEAFYNKKQEAENKANALKHQRDIALAEIENSLALGKIDKETAAKLKVEAVKAKNNQDLAKLKHGYSVALKKTTSASDNKVVDSVVGSDGNIYTRNSKLTDNEAMQIAQSYVDDITPFVTKQKSYDNEGNEVYTDKIDWRAAASYAFQNGLVENDILEQMGFKNGKKSSEGKYLLGGQKKPSKKLP